MSIINDALKKVQSSLKNTDAALPLLEETPRQAAPPHPPKVEPPPPVAAPPQKTLATIEQEQKEKELELKRQPQFMTQRRPSPTIKLLKISFFTFLLICSVLAFLYFAGYLKEIPFAKKFPKISTLVKSFNQKITSLLRDSSSFKSGSSNPEDPPSPKKISPQNLVLKGIVTKNNHQAALINDEIYEEGSSIEGMKIINISSQEVKLLDGDQTITLRIEGER